MGGKLTECLAAVQRGGEAAGVGVGGNVGGGGVQHGVSDDDGVDDALTGDGAEHHGGLIGRLQAHHLNRGFRALTGRLLVIVARCDQVCCWFLPFCRSPSSL